MIIDVTYAICRLNPQAQIVVRGKELDTCTIEWHNNTPEISKADIKTEMDRLQAEYDSLVYARKRKKEYPSLNEFAEAYTEKEFGGDATKIDAYKIKYEKVRSDNPK